MSKRRQGEIRPTSLSEPSTDYPGAGDRIEALRRRMRAPGGERVTVGALAQLAGISRATLSAALNADNLSVKTARKLADVLGVSEESILVGDSPSGQWDPPPDSEPTPSTNGDDLEEWISNLDRIVLTLRNFPGGEIGQKLKIGFLNAVEDIARDTGNKLPLEYYGVRKRVQDGEL